MGRKRMIKELRKINCCMTISPDTYDKLDEMAKSSDMNYSAFITKLIEEYYCIMPDKLLMVSNYGQD